jgi:putative effector of murein hydrolase
MSAEHQALRPLVSMLGLFLYLQLFEQGLSTYTWRNEESSDFIEEATALVSLDVHRNLDIIQTNCREIMEIAVSWSKGTLDVFAARDAESSYLMNELIITQK